MQMQNGQADAKWPAKFLMAGLLPAGMLFVLLMFSAHSALAYQLCNRQAWPLSLAVADFQQNWQSRGWWLLAPGACRDFADPKVPRIYIYAESIGGTALLADLPTAFVPLCVADAAFEFYTQSDCRQAGGRFVPFAEIRLEGGSAQIIEIK